MSEPNATYCSPTDPVGCWCQHCRDAHANTLEGHERFFFHGSRMVVCPDCGNKRCPKANNHDNACTNSNELGQKGSSWENIKPWPVSEPDATYTSHPPVPASPVGGSGPDQLPVVADTRHIETELFAYRAGVVTEEEGLRCYDSHIEILLASHARLEAETTRLTTRLQEEEATTARLKLDRRLGLGRPGVGIVDDKEADFLLSVMEAIIRNAIRERTPATEIMSWLRQIAELPAAPAPPDTEVNDTKETEVPRG